MDDEEDDLVDLLYWYIEVYQLELFKVIDEHDELKPHDYRIDQQYYQQIEQHDQMVLFYNIKYYNMYSAIKNNTVQYILDYEPTPEQLAELNCDSYEEYVEPEETIEAKKIRVFAALVSSPDLSSLDLEWITFTNQEIGDIILERVFGGNPHAESALQAKISSYIISVISGEPNTELLAEIEAKQIMVNEVRNKFWLVSLIS